MIERNFAEQLQLTPEGGAAVKQVNADVGVNWLFSFLSADKKKSYCTSSYSDGYHYRFC